MKPIGTRTKAGLASIILIVAFAAANAHLILTSMRSQPDCVPHLKAPEPEGGFRAAQSSC
ncbi:hypothetical protein [Hyphococcus luteus]|uniref:Uncharacterized protein n=1 Tax=Hyphococcus luteus TaxID=2058213 RepID=A0A2S7KAZ4_9PROT|nr:hypothetical protein [Marinicaulis flavus]PQA89682.1 hypothetical protein CW354_02140 [Marinicaulis flavus]